MEDKDQQNEAARFDELPAIRTALVSAIKQRIVGQDDVIDQMLIALFARGHCLFVGVPGLAKTLLVNTTAQAIGLDFGRIQFTPDLMPSDITGTDVLEEDKESGRRQMRFIKGPVFTNLLLADEINRTPPKTQAALLQAMQEKMVTASGRDYPLELPFQVFATQNPIEQEGTYVLPEAELDRFMFSIHVDYPTEAEEVEVVERTTGETLPPIQAVLSKEKLLEFQRLVRTTPYPKDVQNYAVALARMSRPGEGAPDFINRWAQWGAGPRASQYLFLGARVRAALLGHDTTDIEDVKAVAGAVLAHRIVRNFQAEAEGISGAQIVQRLIEEVPVP